MLDARDLPEHAAYIPTAIQYRNADFPVGYATATALKRGHSIIPTIDQLVWGRIQAPPFRLVGWNLVPDSSVPFAHCEHFACKAVGNAQTIVWGGASDTTLWEISFVGEDALESLARALVALGRG